MKQITSKNLPMAEMLQEIGLQLIIELVEKEYNLGAYQRLLMPETDKQKFLINRAQIIVKSALEDITKKPTPENILIECNDFARVTVYKVLEKTENSITKQAVMEIELTPAVNDLPYSFVVNDAKLSNTQIDNLIN